MIKKFFQKFGIYVSNRQVRLVKFVLLALTTTIVTALAASGYELATDRCTIFVSSGVKIEISPGLTEKCTQALAQAPQSQTDILVIIPLVTIFVLGFAPLVIYALYYFFKLFNGKFREEEMHQSVNYLERDEREQLETMRATRRAYMVLNFALIVAWLYNLVVGNFMSALWFFVIQVLGAMSFRSQIEPKKASKKP